MNVLNFLGKKLRSPMRPGSCRQIDAHEEGRRAWNVMPVPLHCQPNLNLPLLQPFPRSDWVFDEFLDCLTMRQSLCGDEEKTLFLYDMYDMTDHWAREILWNCNPVTLSSVTFSFFKNGVFAE
jgi:hypothetical protein